MFKNVTKEGLLNFLGVTSSCMIKKQNKNNNKKQKTKTNTHKNNNTHTHTQTTQNRIKFHISNLIEVSDICIIINSISEFL